MCFLQYTGRYCDFLQEIAGYCASHSTSFITTFVDSSVFYCELVHSNVYECARVFFFCFFFLQ